MVKYDQIPEFIPGGNPTEYKEWIAFLLDQIRLLKGEQQFTHLVDASISDIVQKDISNVIKTVNKVSFDPRKDGLYETPIIEHGLGTRNLIAEVYSTDSMEPMAFTLLPIDENSIKIVLYEPENILINLDT